MAKSIAGGVEIVNTLSTKNDGDYPLVKAESVGMNDGTTAEEVIKGKLDKNQGASNKGKVLGIGSDGNVIPVDAPTGGGGSGFSGDYNDLINKPTIPSKLSELTGDNNHRTVSDTEKQTWNNKAEKSEIPNVTGLATKAEVEKKANKGTTLTEYGITDATPKTHETDNNAHADIRNDVTRLKEDLKGFVPKQQGAENSGKTFVVGADGNVELGIPQGGGDVNLDAEMKEYMAVVKPKIKQSIINKGGTVLDTDSFKEYSTRIDQIPNNVQAAQTLPPQTKLIGAGVEGGIKLNWQDVGADGYVIVRKIGSAPTTSADGDMIFNGTFPNDGYLDTTAQKSNVYFYRIFPRNKVNQYQSTKEGSIVEVSYIDRTGQKQLKDLEIGDQIVFGKWDTFDRMKWLIVDKQDVRDGYVTTGCNESFPTKQFDAPENSVDNPNPDGNRKNYGNNRWAFANANQWMNSDKPKNEWFSPQHQYDVAPSYKSQNGFLNEFTTYEKSIIVPRNNKTFRCSADGGGYETTIDKMWLPSAYAVNLSMEMAEDGHGLEYFSDNEKRKFNGNNWWLRTINGINSPSHQLRCVGSAGTLGVISANGYCVLRPFCQLSALAYVTWSDSDKAYIFADDSQRIGV